jgi:hypothetical protein
MGIGTSIVLLAVGAILRFAVHASISGISLQTVGVILMVAGVLGIVLSLVFMNAASRRRDVVVDDRAYPRDRPYAP